MDSPGLKAYTKDNLVVAKARLTVRDLHKVAVFLNVPMKNLFQKTRSVSPILCERDCSDTLPPPLRWTQLRRQQRDPLVSLPLSIDHRVTFAGTAQDEQLDEVEQYH